MSAPLFHVLQSSLLGAAGADSATLLAGLLARQHAFVQQRLDGEGAPLTTAPVQGVTDQLTGVDRLRAMLRRVLADLAASSRGGVVGLAPDHVVLALPAWLTQAGIEHLRDGLLACWPSDWAVPSRWSGVARRACAAHAALQHAFAEQVDADRVLLLAVDSLCDPPVLRGDRARNLVHAPGHAEGWVAGEAAAAMLLRPITSPDQAPPGSFVLHRPAVVAAPEGAPPRWPGHSTGGGAGLQRALEEALQQAGMGLHHISHLIGDDDGSAWRATDTGAALARLQVTEAARWLGCSVEPAGRLGQVGAAAGALHWALAHQLHVRGAARVNTVLSYAHDPSGWAAAGVMERLPDVL